MHLFDEIRSLASAAPPAELVKRMSYQAHPAHHAERLGRVLDDPDMGLSRGEYDFVHDSRGFLLALCAALGMDEAATAVRVDDMITRILARDSAFHPWLQAESSETDTAAEGLDRMGRWGLSLGRKVALPDDAQGAALEDLIAMAREAIRRHMLESGGKLTSGGVIDGYLLMHSAEGRSLRLDSTGKVVGAQSAIHAAGV